MAYRSVTIDELVADIFLRLDSEDSRDELVFRDWIWSGLREIGPSRVDRKTVCLPVTNLCIEKPCDFIAAVHLNLLDITGNILNYQYSEGGILESEMSAPRGQNGRFGNSRIHGGSDNDTHIKISETKGYFELSNNGSPASKMEITYVNYPCDKDGEPLIEENIKEAIIYYVEFLYLNRGRHRERSGSNKYPMQEIQVAEDRWLKKRAEVQGKIMMPDPMAGGIIARKWSTQIANLQRNARDRNSYRNRRR